MKNENNFNGIFKIEKVPVFVKQEMTKRAVGDYTGPLEQEDRNFIDDLLYLAWLYAHGFLKYFKFPLEGEIESMDSNGKKVVEKLDGKSLVETKTPVDDLHLYFNEESTIYPGGVASDFSDIYSDYGLIDFKDELVKIKPEKITQQDIIKSIDNYALLQLIKHFNSIYKNGCTILGSNEIIIICLSWLYHHGLLLEDRTDNFQINEHVVFLDLTSYKSFNAFDKGLLHGIPSQFIYYVDFDSIIKIARWDKKEYYLRRHLIR